MRLSNAKILILCFISFFPGCIDLHSDGQLEQIKPVEISDFERDLYLIPGGKYTMDDILANGNMTPSQKFKSFIPAHNPNPKQGDLLCPITMTKANPACSWIIGGKLYQFCCPPCIHEFLAMAKATPEQIEDPEYYVKRPLLPDK
jgi:YHS domain-containing protein